MHQINPATGLSPLYPDWKMMMYPVQDAKTGEYVYRLTQVVDVGLSTSRSAPAPHASTYQDTSARGRSYAPALPRTGVEYTPEEMAGFLISPYDGTSPVFPGRVFRWHKVGTQWADGRQNTVLRPQCFVIDQIV